MKPETILLVDDDPDIRTIAELSLREVGQLNVVLAASGQEALELARSVQPDVILLDVMMPSMDGPTTFARMREEPTTREIPVVFVTAKAQKHEVEAYRNLGAAGVIVKPFDPMDLPNQVRRIVADL